MSRAIDPRRVGFLTGVALIVTSLVGITAPSFAQSAEERTEAAKVARQAYFTAPADGAVPATLTNEVPPGIVCILIPQVCGPQLAPVTGPLGGAAEPVTGAETPDHLSPQPVQPGTLPVGMLGGKPRYTSYLKFDLPSIPKGSLVDRFDLILTETQVSYALESPAFRQAILSGLVAYQTRSPAAFTDFVGQVADQTTPLAATAPTGIELCAVTGPWNAGPSQDASTQPPRDCIFGANGVRDDGTRTWTFDLAFLAQAWLDGTTPNEGVYLGPIGADNLAFGDPDTSTNWQISLGGAEAAAKPQIVYAFSEGFGEDAAADLGSELTLDDSGFDDAGLAPSVDTFGGGSFDASVDTSSFTDLSASSAAGPTASVSDVPRTGGPLRAQLAGESRPRTPWWVWLLLPVGVALAYAYSRSLEQAPPGGRPGRGALTRLTAPAGGDARTIS